MAAAPGLAGRRRSSGWLAHASGRRAVGEEGGGQGLGEEGGGQRLGEKGGGRRQRRAGRRAAPSASREAEPWEREREREGLAVGEERGVSRG
jgi:hypothetical protein